MIKLINNCSSIRVTEPILVCPDLKKCFKFSGPRINQIEMQETPNLICNYNKIGLDWDNEVLGRKSHHFLWMSSVDNFL